MIWLQCRQPLELQAISLIIGKPTFRKRWGQNRFFFSFLLEFSLINSHHLWSLLGERPRPISISQCAPQKVDHHFSVTERQTCYPTCSHRLLWQTDGQSDRHIVWQTDRQTDWFSIVFVFLAAKSFVFFGVLFCLDQHYCAIFTIFLLPPALFSCPLVLWFPQHFFVYLWFTRRVFFCISASYHSPKSMTSFVSTLGKTKENQTSAQSWSLPAPEIVCILGSLLCCSTSLLRHIDIIAARFIVFDPRLPLFQPWSKQKKINQALTPGHCQLLSC